MKLVLLSGGSGKRLWPLSNDSRSKQFLRMLKNKEGDLESMVQRVWGQLDAAGLSKSAVIATSKAQTEILVSQLGDQVPLVVEPERRDTFPAIALAAAYLYTVKKMDPEEVVVVQPVDPFVEEDFFRKVASLEPIIHHTHADLALIGVKPTYPASKYGYIVPETVSTQEENLKEYINVSHFREKPTEDQAKELITQGALWNCGVFAFRLGYILSILEQKGLPTTYHELHRKYSQLPKISFDYEVVERAKHIVVVPFDGYWKDLGTWNTLTEQMATRLIGQGKLSDDSKNTHLINELDIPIAVLGVQNLVVAASPDGILVSSKDASPRVKEVVADFDQIPMYVERIWGWYKVLDYTRSDEEKEVLTRRVCISEGKNLTYQVHYKRDEVWMFIRGEGEVILNNHLISVKPGDVLQIPATTRHSIKANTDLEFIEIQSGTEVIEDDVYRIESDWEAILAICNLNATTA